MKLFVTIAILAVVAVAVQAVTDEQKAKAAEHVKVCSGEAKVTPAELAAAKTNVDTKDPKLQKFAKCFFEKAGFLDNKGNFNEKVAIEKLSAGESDKTKVEQLVKLCQKDLSTDKNEVPLQLYKCYTQHKAL